MLHQVPRVREAKRAVAALKEWGRCLVRANLQMMMIIVHDVCDADADDADLFTFAGEYPFSHEVNMR